MVQKILFIIDDIKTLNHKKDSSLVMIENFQKRGYEVYISGIHDLSFSKEAGPQAIAQTLELSDNYYQDETLTSELGETQTLTLQNFQMVFMRKDPPVNDAYLNALKVLNLAKDITMVNPPDKLQILNEKLFALEFPDLIPDTCYTSHKKIALAFAQKHSKVILKPIDGMGGKGIFISSHDDPNFSVIFETLSQNFTQSVLIQEFIPDISKGDKRILIVNGKIFDYALARIPDKGQIRGNLAAGGSYKAVKLSNNDYKISEIVAQRLKQENILICGIDVIGDKLIEINITSPTCFQELRQLTGKDAFELFF